MINRKLKRNVQNRMLGGVCSGISDYFNIDVILVRLIFIIGSVSAYPFFLLYIVLWIITPKNEIEVKYNKTDKYSNE